MKGTLICICQPTIDYLTTGGAEQIPKHGQVRTEFRLYGRLSRHHIKLTFLLLNQPNKLFHIGHKLKGAESILLMLDASV